jgi:hypothetical protein
MKRVDSSKINPAKDHLNLTKIGSFLALGKPSFNTVVERNISLNDESIATSDTTNSSGFLGQPYTPINSTRANIFEVVDDTENTYIGRVFSPFNVSRNDSRDFNKKYDFMVAISGSSKITPDEQAQLRELITKEFNQFLLETTLPSLAIIVVIVTFLTGYAYWFISRRINNLTKLVDNPHDEKNKARIKAATTKGPDQPMDEIERLESIFAHFFNEEKYKVKQGEKLQHGDRKKVSMLPMRTTLNIFRDPKSNGDEVLKKLL